MELIGSFIEGRYIIRVKEINEETDYNWIGSEKDLVVYILFNILLLGR